MPGGAPPKAGGRKCGAQKSDGRGKCEQPAGAGTDHLGWGKCKFHGGNSSALKTAAAREEAAAVVEGLRTLGNSEITPVEPVDVLLQEVHRSAAVVAYFDQVVRDLESSDAIFLTEQGYKPRAFIDVWTQQRSHMARVCKMALDAGVAERAVKVAEAQGALLAQVIRAILDDLDLTADQMQEAPAIVRKHLTLIAS